MLVLLEFKAKQLKTKTVGPIKATISAKKSELTDGAKSSLDTDDKDPVTINVTEGTFSFTTGHNDISVFKDLRSSSKTGSQITAKISGDKDELNTHLTSESTDPITLEVTNKYIGATDVNNLNKLLGKTAGVVTASVRQKDRSY